MTNLSTADAFEIIDALARQSESGRLEWTQFGGSDDEYGASTDRFMYYIGSRDDDGLAPYRLQIWKHQVTPDGKAMMIEEFESTVDDLRSAIERLYRSARGKALGLDRLKDDILRDLGEAGQ